MGRKGNAEPTPEQLAQRELRKAQRAWWRKEVTIFMVVALLVAAVAWWLYDHRDEIGNQTPPADCTPPAVTLGCGGVSPAP